jgi:hypothetical protein
MDSLFAPTEPQLSSRQKLYEKVETARWSCSNEYFLLFEFKTALFR